MIDHLSPVHGHHLPSAMTTDETAYNIIPIDVPARTNVITSFPEVRAAISSLKFTDLPKLPNDAIAADVLDFLQYVFGFQKDSVSNQRENIVILLSDEQSRLSSLVGENPTLDDAAVKKVFDNTFDNYINWCTYVKNDELWKKEEITRKYQILYISLYYLIWGEAANVRFLPECLCYIFHKMKIELDHIISKGQKEPAKRAKSCDSGDGASYLKQVICPLYDVIASEANNSGDGALYSSWRNYDDFNEYFWSDKCFQLSWPLDRKSEFFQKPSTRSTSDPSAGSSTHPSAGSKVAGKTFIEDRSFLHLYHSFHRLWIFLVMMFQVLVIIAWNDGKVLDFKTLRGFLSLGPTYFLMKLVQCALDLCFMMDGARSKTGIIKRFIWFMWATLSIYVLYVKGLDVNINPYLQLIIFKLYIIVLVIYVAIESYQSRLAFVLNWCDNSFVGRFLRVIPQEDCYVGRGLTEARFNHIRYMLFWLLILVINFAYAYFNLIMPLVTSSRDIVLENTQMVLAIGSSWVVVFCGYLLGVHIIYIVISASVAFLLGAWDGLGKIRSMHHVEKNFKSFPEAFMLNLHITRDFPMENVQDLEKENAARFSPFWNEIVDNLWEEDYITNEEQESLRMPQSSQGTEDTTVKWPRFLDNKLSEEQFPKNQEARRRLVYFTNSLFMVMPKPVAVRKILAFSVFTPYLEETVLYSMDELYKDIGQGNTILVYLQKTYPDEWENFLARMHLRKSTSVSYFLENVDDKLILELRFWASYRGQTLARTVRGMMYNRKALRFQSYMESAAVQEDSATKTEKSDQFRNEERAYADLKFTYVITCQLYSKQKKAQQPQAADIALLLERNGALRVAFIDEEDMGNKQTKYSSKLVKYCDINGKEKEVYSIELPGKIKLGEGKPENQNHAIVFTRGNAVQTIDMNQDNYFEESLKMRNLLEEFRSDHRIHPATILGVREHIYTERASTVASFMSKQENSFVTITQRLLANLLKVRMHYGHPDVFDRVFHITRGGISKASHGINVSEDIYAGFNSTLRKGNITHHEYIQVGKGRDVGLHEISIFEKKVAEGNGEQVLNRDVYKLGQRFDFFRMLSFYYTSVGYYFYNWLMVITLYILLYVQLIAPSEIHVANMSLSVEWLLIFPAISIILGSLLEQDFEVAGTSYVTMLISGSLSFFSFSLGTRMHWFGRTILHGGSGYKATGRGFNLAHTNFLENYKRYSRSHFVKAVEMILLGLFNDFEKTRKTRGFSMSDFGYFLALAWIIVPFWFDPSDLTDDDHMKDFNEWGQWLGGKSWEEWWEEEIPHIQTLEGKCVETFLSLRFFIIQYAVYQRMDVLGAKTYFLNLGIWWLVAVAVIVFFEMRKTRRLSSVNVQMLSELIQKIQFKTITILFIAFSIIHQIQHILVFILAFIPTVWGILSICVALKPVMIDLGLWDSVKSLARIHEFAIGTTVFFIISIKRIFRWPINNAGNNPPDEITEPTTGDANVSHANVIEKQSKLTKVPSLNAQGNQNSRDGHGEKPAFPFNVEADQCKIFMQTSSHDLQINEDEVSQLRFKGMLDVNILTVFEMSLYHRPEQSNNRCGFLNPSLIANHLGNNAQSDATSYLKHVVESQDYPNYKFLLAPYYLRAHWVLFIICPNKKKGFILDSCKQDKNKDSYPLTSVVKEVVDKDIEWVFVECNQQPESWECGYYVLKWMHDFVTKPKYRDNFLNKIQTPNWTNEPLSKEDIKDIVDKWFEFCRQLPGLEELNSCRTDNEVALAKQPQVKLTMSDDGVNANVDDQANPSNSTTKEKKEEMESAEPKNHNEESSHQPKQENARRLIADSEKAKKMEELTSTLAKAMVLAKELDVMVQVPKESLSIDSPRENALMVTADSETAKELEELNSGIEKAMVLAEEFAVKLARSNDDVNVNVNANVTQEQLEAGNASSNAPSDLDSQVTASKVEAFKLDMLEESRKMAGELVPVLQEKDEYESSIEQVEFRQKVENPLASEQGEGNTPQARTRNE